MKRAAVTSLVVERAHRFGDRNPQELAYLQRRLSEAESQEVLAGLLDVFSESEPPPAGSLQQELAGKLLEVLKPQGVVELETLLRHIAPHYELSVEQLPQHLALVCGRDQVLAQLELLKSEPGTGSYRQALDTMAFWLGAKLGEAA